MKQQKIVIYTDTTLNPNYLNKAMKTKIITAEGKILHGLLLNWYNSTLVKSGKREFYIVLKEREEE